MMWLQGERWRREGGVSLFMQQLTENLWVRGVLSLTSHL